MLTPLVMTGSCVISGISGAIVPLVLKKYGADPATASSIVLTTITDVAALGVAVWAGDDHGVMSAVVCVPCTLVASHLEK